MKKILLALICIFSMLPFRQAYAQALEDYLNTPDPAYSWNIISEESDSQGKLSVLELSSQNWHGSTWKHRVAIFIPINADSKLCLLQITGHKDPLRNIELMKNFSARTKNPSATLSSVPNQPLFDGKTEDKLLAYTFRKYIDTGDKSWPVIFPMVKSAIKAMDSIGEYTSASGSGINSFVVSGSSKRAWTTYLTAANDKRVKGLIPLVFDMLNMKAQTDWAKEMYGEQSEKIREYTELGLIDRIDEPRTKELRHWIDPFYYKEKLTAPKLILLGTNDPYWLVDSQIHYFPELPGEKLIYQVPGGSHHIGDNQEVINNIENWFELLDRSKPMPEISWKIQKEPAESLIISSSIPIIQTVIWQADSAIRDFRHAKWEKISTLKGTKTVEFLLKSPKVGFRAWVGEVSLAGPFSTMKLSTSALVKP